MSLSNSFNAINEKTPSETKKLVVDLYSGMMPERFFEHTDNLRNMAITHGQEKEREEIVYRLLASGMSAEEIAVILCIRADAVRIIENNNAEIKIPDYAKKLKERRRRIKRKSQ